MTSKIRLLSEVTINQIAAGEVVENVSSVIKELVENALDAGSTEIFVETIQSGRQLIKISDNGEGMGYDDALLCFERHATSKIKETNDLNSLATLGFRGEALAAIASISKIKLMTKDLNERDQASIVYVEGGKIIQVQKGNRSKGTTMEVRSLFYNVPVRKRFQNSLNYEFSEIYKLLMAFSFANPLVQFHWVNDQKKELELFSHGDDFFFNLKQRIESTCGKEVAQELIKVDEKINECSLQGYLVSPQLYRSHRKQQFFFLNGRLVQSSLLSQAISEGFGYRLPEGKFPICFLHLQLPSKWIDANIHPQKKEVRLQEEVRIKQIIKERVAHLLQKNLQTKVYSNSTLPQLYPMLDEKKQQNYFLTERTAQESFLDKNVSLPLKKNPEIIGIWKNFIFIDGPSWDDSCREELLVFEQKKLEAKLLFESLMRLNTNGESCPLLLPDIIELTKDQYRLALESIPYLEKMGFQISQLSGKTLLVNAIPQWIEIKNVKEFILIAIEQVHAVSMKNSQDLLKQWIVTSLKFIKKRTLNLELAKKWIEELLKHENRFEDIAGKPLYQKISLDFFQKLSNGKLRV